MVITIITFLIVLGILVFVHELGHFIAAKKAGVVVEEFSIFIPPRVWSKKVGETRYSINLIPFGGYVKMLGEMEESKNSRSFGNQSKFKRFMISISGVLMNIILAWVILTIGFSFGMPPLISEADSLPGEKNVEGILVIYVEEGSVAENVGFSKGDIIYSATVDDKMFEFASDQELIDFTKSHLNQEVNFNAEISGERKDIKVSVSDNEEAPLGIAPIDNLKVKIPWYQAPHVALRETYMIGKATVEVLGDLFGTLFTKGKIVEGVGGPVAIYSFTSLAVDLGWMIVIQFVALLSIGLAMFNILPFPALDGGRILFIILESIFGKKVVKESVENTIHLIGFGLLIVLFILLTYNDILRLIR